MRQAIVDVMVGKDPALYAWPVTATPLSVYGVGPQGLQIFYLSVLMDADQPTVHWHLQGFHVGERIDAAHLDYLGSAQQGPTAGVHLFRVYPSEGCSCVPPA